jgi:hypothetical protein
LKLKIFLTICDKEQLDDKNRWISCFRCAAWCCYACAPDQFERASATVYYYENYIKLMEDEDDFFIDFILL